MRASQLSLCAALFSFVAPVHAQYGHSGGNYWRGWGYDWPGTITFCVDQPMDNTCNEWDTEFLLPSGGIIYALLSLEGPVLDDTIVYEIYTKDVYRDEYGHEIYNTTLYEPVQPDWLWDSKALSFYATGTYVIYAWILSEYNRRVSDYYHSDPVAAELVHIWVH